MLIEQNARYLLEQMRAADPGDAVRYSAAVKNLAGSLAELSGGGETTHGLRDLINKLNQKIEVKTKMAEFDATAILSTPMSEAGAQGKKTLLPEGTYTNCLIKEITSYPPSEDQDAKGIKRGYTFAWKLLTTQSRSTATSTSRMRQLLILRVPCSQS